MGRSTNKQGQATQAIGSVPKFGVYQNAQDELYPLLNSELLVRDMRLMALTDETVGAMMWCISTMMAQIDFTYVPQVDGIDNESDPKAVEAAQLANSMLADMDTPFSDHIDDFLTMLWAGFAPVEIVMKQRNGNGSRFKDKLYGIGTLNLLDQTTIWDWGYDANQKIVSLTQMAFDGGGQIPREKVLLYRTTAQYQNPRGRPLLLSAWRIWKLKKRVQDSEAIGIERDMCGLPVMGMPEAIFDAAEEMDEADPPQPTPNALKAQARIAAGLAAVKDMRFNKSGGLLKITDTFSDEGEGDRTPKYSFEIVTTAGQRSIDTRTVVRDYDRGIARVGMMQFLQLGDRAGGSYGLSDDQSSMAVRSMMSLAQKLVAQWNLICTPYVWSVNGFDPKYRPRLRYSDLTKDGIAQIGAFLAGLGKSVDFWAGDPKMRVGLAKAANLPYDAAAQTSASETFNKTQDLAATKPAQADLFDPTDPHSATTDPHQGQVQ